MMISRNNTLTSLSALVFGVTLMVSGAGAIGSFPLQTSDDLDTDSEPHKKLETYPLSKLPRWAQQAVKIEDLGRRYEVMGTIVDLDNDDQPELLISMADPIPGVFIPHRPLKVLSYHDDSWRVAETESYCQPRKLGAFSSNGYWDLVCKEEGQLRTLRWDGDRYAYAESV